MFLANHLPLIPLAKRPFGAVLLYRRFTAYSAGDEVSMLLSFSRGK